MRSRSISEIVNEVFEDFEDESTEFILSIAIERVSCELNMELDKATDKVMNCLYNERNY